MGPARLVAHVDMDAFFASVAQLDDPALAGQPVLVGGSGPRAVVCAASYEARAFGARSAMPMHEARRLCPQARIVRPDGKRYRELHRQLREVWEGFTPDCRVASFDEAYLDLSGTSGLWGTPEATGRAIKAATRERTGLPCTIGLATSRLVAKIASKAHKPDGLGVIPPGGEHAFLSPLPLAAVPGIGPKTAERFRRVGLVTIGQALALSEAERERALGDPLLSLALAAQGREAPWEAAGGPRRQLSVERTFPRDRTDPARVAAALRAIAFEAAHRLRREGLVAQHLTLKLRFASFETRTHGRALTRPSADPEHWAPLLAELLAERWSPGTPLRLLGVSAGKLSAHAPLSLFPDPEAERRERLWSTLDRLHARHGRWLVAPGSYEPGKPGA